MTPFVGNTSLSPLQREVSRLFDEFLPGAGRTGGWPGTADGAWAPRGDFAETDESYVVWLDLPGVTKDQVDISVENETLTVSGERQMVEESSNNQYYRIERPYGRFLRSFTFATAINQDSVRAQLENGVLMIHVDKAEESKPRKITIS